MKLFELDDRPVASFDPNNALVFDSGKWRLASIYTARSALAKGYEMSRKEFAAAFPEAATALSRVDLQELRRDAN